MRGAVDDAMNVPGRPKRQEEEHGEEYARSRRRRLVRDAVKAREDEDGGQEDEYDRGQPRILNGA